MKVVRYIDKVSEWVGAIFAWLIIPLMLVVCYEVVLRYAFNAPTGWAYDTSWMLYSTIFLMGGAYTLLYKKHVRIDIVYNLLSPRGKAIFDVVVYAVVFLFVLVLLSWTGIKFAAAAWETGERLSTTNWFFPAGPIKTVMAVAFLLLGLQSLAELIRNLLIVVKREEF